MSHNERVAPAELETFEVIFTGAGASAAWPSRLPGGGELGASAVEAFATALDDQLTVALGDMRDVLSTLARPTGIDKDGIRLEQLMEQLGQTSRGLPLVEIYDRLNSDVPNNLHMLIAQTGLPIVTSNIDLLHEQAAQDLAVIQGTPAGHHPSIDHVHGRYGDDLSISTTISQYEQGLRDEAEKAFAGKAVLVIGWAGRDWDIAQAFLRHRPSRLLWLEYPDKQTNQTPTADALTLLSLLDQRAGSKVTEWRICDATVALTQALGKPPPLLRDTPTRSAPLNAAGFSPTKTHTDYRC